LKVLQLTTWYQPAPGGIELHVKRLAAELKKLGSEVTVMTLTPAAVDAVSFSHFTIPGVPLGFGIVPSPSLYRAVLEEEADVVHAQGYGWPMSWVGYVAKKLGHTALVFTTHSSPYTPIYPLFDLCRALPVRASDAVIVTTDQEAERVKRLGVEGSRITVLPNGVDRPSPAPRTMEGSYILCVGRMEFRSKGQDILLKAFERGGFRETLVYAGDGPDLGRLREMVSGRRDVVVLGGVDEARKASLLSNADLVVMPSRVEPFGIVGLEAVSYGRRLVATRVGGLQHIMEPYAVLAEPDVGDIERAMRASLGGEPVPPTADFFERYSWKNIAARTLEVYERVSGLGR
jgi:glycosyltransferase involved in cell wall biosynthesis